MTTKERLQSDFDRMAQNPMFGEQISYYESSSNTTHANEYAVVYRNKLMQFSQRNAGVTSSQVKYDIEIRICNKRILTVTEKNDVVSLPVKMGGAIRSFRVAAIIDQDPATYKLGLVA